MERSLVLAGHRPSVLGLGVILNKRVQLSTAIRSLINRRLFIRGVACKR